MDTAPKKTSSPYPPPKSNKACSNCRASKVACEKNKRPCSRCIRTGIADSCVDVPRKKKAFKSYTHTDTNNTNTTDETTNTSHNANPLLFSPSLLAEIHAHPLPRTPLPSLIQQLHEPPITNSVLVSTSQAQTQTQDSFNPVNILESDPQTFNNDFVDFSFTPTMSSNLMYSSSEHIANSSTTSTSSPSFSPSDSPSSQEDDSSPQQQTPPTPQTYQQMLHTQQTTQTEMPQSHASYQSYQQTPQYSSSYSSSGPPPAPFTSPTYVQQLKIPIKVNQPIPAPGSFIDPNTINPSQRQEMVNAMRAIRTQQQELLNTSPNYQLSQPMYSQLGWAKFSTASLHLLDCNDAWARLLGCAGRSHMLFGMGILFWKQILHPALHLIGTKTAYDALANGIDKFARPCVLKKLDGTWLIANSNITLHPQAFVVDVLNVEGTDMTENDVRDWFSKT